MTGVQAIAAGEYHSLILKTDGTLFACELIITANLATELRPTA
jgi:alpha-tubulin suppressor-like RCC1 family protein